MLVSIRGDQDVNDVKLSNELSKLASDYGGTTLLTLEVPDEEAQQTWAAKPLPWATIAPDLEDDYIRSDLEDMAPKFLRMVDQTRCEFERLCHWL